MTGIALGWIGSISGFGSQVRNAKTSPSVDGRHMPANAATGVPVTENQISSRPALGLGSAKRVKGTRQRCSGFDSIDRQNGLARFRTFVTRFVIIDPGRSEEPTSELQSIMRLSYDVFCLQQQIQYAT